MVRAGLLFGILLSVPLIAVPEIEKVGQVCEQGVCLAWWPKLVSAPGWHHERAASFQNGVNVQVPDGLMFSNAETVIYAKAAYKARIPEAISLAAFIKNDQNEFRKDDPSIAITEVTPLKTKDGKAFASYTFFPKDKGNWEEVSYGEEGEYYLIFTISSRSHAGLLGALPVFEQYIALYKE
jgi:hypothetical protein